MTNWTTYALIICEGFTVGLFSRFFAELIEEKATKNRNLEKVETSKLWYYLTYLISGTLTAAVFWFSRDWIWTAYFALILMCLMTVSVMDWKYRRIPNSMVLAILCIKLAFGLPYCFGAKMFVETNILMSLIGFAVMGTLMFLPAVISKKIGYGDVKLAMAVGFSLELMGSLYAIIFMGIFYVIFGIMSMGGAVFRSYLKTMLPMGPFMSAAVAVILVLLSM